MRARRAREETLVGVGVDVVALDRVVDALGAYGDTYVRRILSSEERKVWQEPDAFFLASAIAIKEATYKSVGQHAPRLWWHDVEMRPLACRRTGLRLAEQIAEIVREAAGAGRVEYLQTAVKRLHGPMLTVAGRTATPDAAIAVAVALAP